MAKTLTKAQIKAKAIETKKAEMKKQYTELSNVVDKRTGLYHSVAVVKEPKHFVPVEEYQE